MGKSVRPPFSWKVLIHDWNSNTVRTYDVLTYIEAFIKKLKKQHATKEAFIDALDRHFMWRYWSKSEYELILYVEGNRVFIEPWVGEFKDGRIDITEDTTLDWPKFAEHMLKLRPWRDKETGLSYVKFDVYDQLKFRFNELTEFIWTYPHKYQRHKNY